MLKDLIHAPTSKTLEFKRDLSSPRPLPKKLVAFFNNRIVVENTELLLHFLTVGSAQSTKYDLNKMSLSQINSAP
jgi:hypothetical protein